MLRHVLLELFRRIGRRRPLSGPAAQARLAEGLACQQRGDLSAAERAYRAVVASAPDHAQALHLLGHVLGLRGRLDESVEVLSRAAALAREDAHVRFNLAQGLRAQRRFAQAEESLREALRIRPQFAGAWLSLADVLVERGSLDEAEDCFRKALEADPGFAEAHYNYGNLLHRIGRINEAVDCYREAVARKPDFVRAHSNLVYALNFSSDFSPEEIFREHQEWARRHAEPLSASRGRHSRPLRTDRALRVGYVSPNFRDHAVTYFFEPVLKHHDPDRVAVYCYSDVRHPDERTERLRRYPCVWRDISGQSDDAVAERIRQDGIDVLVDLTGHTDDHRLLVFARQPAPVQVTWNGYANTTGMTAMTYRISDGYADPPGMTERLHSERLIRLPEIYMVFQPPAEGPAAGPPPMSANGYATFGSFNAISKLTPRVLALWARLLREVEGARLLLFTVPEGRTRDRLRTVFAENGVDPGRIEFRGRLPFRDFLAAHGEADIALDPFPFNGTTTTCHSLWMGVPVVSLAGRTHASRVGVSMLSNLGLERLVARDESEYVSIAARLVRDPAALATLRANLRGRFMSAPNTDGTRFTRFLEEAYVTMWAEYCEQRTAL